MLGKISLLFSHRFNPYPSDYTKLRWFMFVWNSVWISNSTALKRQEQWGQGRGCTRASVSGCNYIGERVQAKSSRQTQPPFFCIKKLETLLSSSEATRDKTLAHIFLWLKLFCCQIWSRCWRLFYCHSWFIIIRGLLDHLNWGS